MKTLPSILISKLGMLGSLINPNSVATGKRTNALQVLIIMELILGSISIGVFQFGPTIIWIQLIFPLLAVIVLIVFLIAYLYGLFKNPDLLRSEVYLIQKLQIDKAGYGEATDGIFIEEEEMNESSAKLVLKSPK